MKKYFEKVFSNSVYLSDMSDLPPAIFLMGPTAAGKTALALELHNEFPVEIISVDSSQVYRGMDIGTAKPTREAPAAPRPQAFA